MKNGITFIVGCIVVFCSASLFLVAANNDKNQQSKNPVEKFSNEQNMKHTSHVEPQIMEVPESYSASQGELLTASNGKLQCLPLLHTDVNGAIEGFTARVNVHQTFINSSDSTIEAIYTFPLPENAAVDSMILEFGDKRIKGMIKERREAREIYEKARRMGNTASLLEQQRPNIFTQSIANILPGDTIVITISYLQQLKYKNGRFLFNFPMVVGPRYIPGTPRNANDTRSVPPTDQVPDAHRITPPILTPNATRNGHDISLTLTIHNCSTFKKLTSPSHRIELSDSASSKIIRIAPSDQIPNKDFMLEYTIAGNDINTVFLTNKPDKGDGFFQLTMLPKIDIDNADIIPRELVFVVDNSGSMSGFPIEKCKELMTISLNKMRPKDLFRVITFSGSTRVLSPKALVATKNNITQALEFVDGMHGGGGTEMMQAINELFNTPVNKGCKRLVLFMTDGYVGNEREIFAAIEQRLGTSRVFSLGVGSSVNHYLLENMAYVGRGSCTIIRHDGEAQKAIDEFYALIDAPVLTDLTLSWNGVTIIDPQPALLPDLFHSQPLTVFGTYRNAGAGTLTIKGTLSGNRSWKKNITITLPKHNQENQFLPTLWARKKIEQLDFSLNQSYRNDDSPQDEQIKKEITDLGLRYRIMTSYTSFVAVDDAVRNKSGKWTSIEQPVELPDGVSENSQPGSRFVDIAAALSGVNGFNASGSGLNLKKSGSLKVSAPEFTKGGAITGARSKASIMRSIMQNVHVLRSEYNKRLKEKPDLKGKITVKFAIDEFGNVVFAQVVESTMGDSELEKIIVVKIKLWTFEKIDKPGDVTEVIYPFVFSK